VSQLSVAVSQPEVAVLQIPVSVSQSAVAASQTQAAVFRPMVSASQLSAAVTQFAAAVSQSASFASQLRCAMSAKPVFVFRQLGSFACVASFVSPDSAVAACGSLRKREGVRPVPCWTIATIPSWRSVSSARKRVARLGS
jgi:hypothetical protein